MLKYRTLWCGMVFSGMHYCGMYRVPTKRMILSSMLAYIVGPIWAIGCNVVTQKNIKFDPRVCLGTIGNVLVSLQCTL